MTENRPVSLFDAENARLENATPRDRLAWAVDRWGQSLLFTSSFGAGSGVLLHLWSLVARELPVVMIDTGFLFEETHRYKDELVARLGLRVDVVKPEHTRAEFLREYGDDIYRRDPDFCCGQNKVVPLQPREQAAKAWISGLRRDQSKERASTPIILEQEGGPTKIHPIATLSRADVESYMREHDIPEHPLREKGYVSIGCEPCTRAIKPGEDERAGRWAWSGKSECGLHTLRRKPA
jgi:phosphoadenosine phosphosulfate reductase